MAVYLFPRNRLLILLWLLLFPLQANVADCREVRFAASAWEPYTGIDGNGQGQGIYVEILEKIFEQEMGLELKVQFFPWKRAQYNVKNGLADVAVTVASEERLQYTLKSEQQVLDLSLIIFTYPEHPKFSQISRIKEVEDIGELGLQPVTNLGNNWHRDNIDRLGVKTIYVPAEKNSFEFLAAKRADITLEPLFAGTHLIQSLSLQGKVVATSGRLEPLPVHLLVSKKSPMAAQMDEINKALNKLSAAGEVEKILEKYR